MTTSFKQALGKLIADLRRERRLSQEKLALEADIDRTRMGAIERGQANPTIDTLEKIAEVLGQTPVCSQVQCTQEVLSFSDTQCRS